MRDVSGDALDEDLRLENIDVERFVKDKCLAIMEDVVKLDSVLSAGRFHSLPAPWLLPGYPAAVPQRPSPDREPDHLQQQHVDHKIAEALLKKGTINAYRTWTGESRATKAVESLAVVGRRVASHESGFHQSSRGLALSACSSRPFISTRKAESWSVASSLRLCGR